MTRPQHAAGTPIDSPRPSRRRLVIPLLAIVLAACIAALVTWRYSSAASLWTPHDRASAVSGTTPAYAGSGACATCHSSEASRWRGSQHAAAMAEASGRTVLGKFDGAHFDYAGVTSTFSTRGGRFYVRTDGADGRLAEFEVKYTFGVQPLQQYLVELSGGRLQALSIAWDTRAAASGGQRWFHLYPHDTIRAGDPLHWTGLQQNWNFMCADCHSTNIRKAYDASARVFATTWSEVSVGCEACHGPGSEHIAWARRGGSERDRSGASYLTARLDERKGIRWDIDRATGTVARSAARGEDREIAVCARCHALRSQITDEAKAGDSLEDGFRASALDASVFHPDGQQRGEVYSYASFLQSRMYAKGVTCSDCHDPHSGTLRLAGNATCTQCHLPAKYDAAAHHFHRAASPAAACVTCHMAPTTYMVIDPRHDHSFRIPRPDRTVSLGVPNACTTSCHRNRSASWAAAEVERRTGHAPRGSQEFADAFHAADRDAPGAGAALTGLVHDPTVPAIARASALERIAGGGRVLDEATAVIALRDTSPLVRRGALAALQHADQAMRMRLVPPLLRDRARTVRSQAVLSLADIPEGDLPVDARGEFTRAFNEYMAELRFNADRPEAGTSLGTLLAARGQFDDAITALRDAIAIDRTYVPAVVNLADIYRAQGEEAGAERVLREGIAATPAAAELHHALGLSLVRQRRTSDALGELALAVRLDASNARYAYVQAVALHDTAAPAEAVAILTASLARHPYDRDTLSLLAAYAEEAGRLQDAERYASRLAVVDPDDREARALVSRLRHRPGR